MASGQVQGDLAAAQQRMDVSHPVLHLLAPAPSSRLPQVLNHRLALEKLGRHPQVSSTS